MIQKGDSNNAEPCCAIDKVKKVMESFKGQNIVPLHIVRKEIYERTGLKKFG